LFEQRFQIARKETGLPDAGNNLRKKPFHYVLRDKILHDSLEYFSSLGQGFLQSSILNEEKALGTRLAKHFLYPRLCDYGRITTGESELTTNSSEFGYRR